MVLTDFAVYLAIAIPTSFALMILGWLFDRANNIGVIEFIIGVGIWTAIITFVCWIIHMVILGINVS